jgi:single-strand DNA-binding protein
MLIASIYARVGQDPVARTTKSGHPMTTASVAVDVAGKDAEPSTLWVSILAFGAAAEALLRASKGEMVAAVGKLSRGSYTTAAGEPREQWTMLADSVVTAKSAKPAGRPRGQAQGQQRTQGDARRNEASRRFQDPRTTSF